MIVQAINMVMCILQGAITNILEESVVQPLLVSTSAITLASETVRSILKIDDIVSTLFCMFMDLTCMSYLEIFLLLEDLTLLMCKTFV